MTIEHFKTYDTEGKEKYLCNEKTIFKEEKATERLHEVTCPKCREILQGKNILE